MLCDSNADVEAQWRRWGQRHGVAWSVLRESMHGRRSIDLIGQVAPHLDAAVEAAVIDAAQTSDTSGTVAALGATAFLAPLPLESWGIVTSAPEALARARLRAVQIPVPPVLVSAEHVAAGKPSPEGYRLAARLLEVEPARCLVVEDAPAGVAAGRSAGASVLALETTHAKADLGAADVVVADLGAVRAGVDRDGLRILAA